MYFCSIGRPLEQERSHQRVILGVLCSLATETVLAIIMVMNRPSDTSQREGQREQMETAGDRGRGGQWRQRETESYGCDHLHSSGLCRHLCPIQPQRKPRCHVWVGISSSNRGLASVLGLLSLL